MSKMGLYILFIEMKVTTNQILTMGTKLVTNLGQWNTQDQTYILVFPIQEEEEDDEEYCIPI